MAQLMAQRRRALGRGMNLRFDQTVAFGLFLRVQRFFFSRAFQPVGDKGRSILDLPLPEEPGVILAPDHVSVTSTSEVFGGERDPLLALQADQMTFRIVKEMNGSPAEDVKAAIGKQQTRNPTQRRPHHLPRPVLETVEDISLSEGRVRRFRVSGEHPETAIRHRFAPIKKLPSNPVIADPFQPRNSHRPSFCSITWISRWEPTWYTRAMIAPFSVAFMTIGQKSAPPGSARLKRPCLDHRAVYDPAASRAATSRRRTLPHRHPTTPRARGPGPRLSQFLFRENRRIAPDGRAQSVDPAMPTARSCAAKPRTSGAVATVTGCNLIGPTCCPGRGKFVAVAGQEAFIADTPEEAWAWATKTHPEDDGALIRHVRVGQGPAFMRIVGEWLTCHVLNHFDVILSRRRNEVLLLAPNHQYRVELI